MDVRDINRTAWDKQVDRGNPYTKPVTAEAIEAARRGEWQISLTDVRPIPRAWFPDNLRGLKVLGLAAGGGQQGPILAAAGATVTVFDNSPKQLAQDRRVAEREGLPLATVEGDMSNLAVFADGSFDLIVHPVSNVFVPDVNPVWTEAYRVLRPGGSLLLHEVLAGPASEQMRYPVPWAREAGNSHLVVADVLESSLQAAGFHSITIDDWSADALQWRQRQHQKETGRDRPVLSPAMILGPEFKQMGANVLHNLAQDAAQVTEIMALKN